MIQIDHDIEMLKLKLEGEFNQYAEVPQGEPIDQIYSAMNESGMLNTHIQYGRYLSHIQGRKRVFNMHKMTRDDLLYARRLHRESQKAAYEDIKTVFLSLGGLIT